MKQTIDTYRLTSMEEPTEAFLSQIMREAAEEAAQSNHAATRLFFDQLRQAAAKVDAR